MLTADHRYRAALVVFAAAVIIAGCKSRSSPVPLATSLPSNAMEDCRTPESSDTSGVTWEQCITPPQSGAPQFGDPGGNGTKLLGLGIEVKVANKIRFLGVRCIDATSIEDRNGKPISSVKVTGLDMTGLLEDGTRIDGDKWQGATLRGKLSCLNPKWMYPISLRIRSVADSNITEMAGGRPSFQFGLEIRRPVDSVYGDACVASEPDPPVNIAFPVSGAWDGYGNYADDVSSKIISFACLKHVVFECLESNYPIHDNNPDKVDLFKACTRMMRADYCGLGVPLTHDNMQITVRDTMHISPWPVPTARTFEGAWLKDKALCVDHLRVPMTDPALKDANDCALRLLKEKQCHNEAEAMAWLGNSPQPLLFNYSQVPVKAAQAASSR